MKLTNKSLKVGIIVVVGLLLLVALMFFITDDSSEKQKSNTGNTNYLPSQRDTRRRQLANDFDLQMAVEFNNLGRYPNVQLIDFLSEHTKYSEYHFLKDALETSENGTAYCFKLTGKLYVIGVQLEKGEWFYGGTDSDAECGY